MGPIRLLNLFTAAGEDGDEIYTTWVPYPSLYNGELWVDCKMFFGGQVDLVLQSSMDMDDHNAQDVATKAITATGSTVTTITTKLGAFVRLKVGLSVGSTNAVLSAWLQPKDT